MKSDEYMGNNLNSIIWDGTHFIVAGHWKTTLRSTDGVNWEKKTEKNDIDLQQVLWNGYEYLTVGRYGEIFTSKDGRNGLKTR